MSFIPAHIKSVTSDRLLHAMSTLFDQQIGMVITMDGAFDVERLQHAFRLSLDAEPHLGCRFIPQYRGAYWERIKNLKPTDFFEAKEAKDLDSEQTDFFTETIDYCKGPQVKALLLRGGQNRLCLKISHLASDAGGLKQYAYLLSSIYRNLDEHPDFLPQPNLGGSRSMQQVRYHLGVKGHFGVIRRAFRDMVNNPPFQSPRLLPTQSALPERPFYIVRHINRQQYLKISKAAKSLSVTINDYTMAAMLRGIYHVTDELKDTALRLIVTADLRGRYLPNYWNSGICNLSGWVFPNIGTDPGNSIEDTSRLVSGVMNRMKKDYIGLGAAPMLIVGKICPLGWLQPAFEFIFLKAFEKKIDHLMSAHLFTNMGQIDDRKLNFGHIEVQNAFLLPPIIHPPFWGAGISGYKDTLTLSSGFCSSGIDAGLVEDLFDRIQKEMELP